MDLLDFSPEDLYFDHPPGVEVARLLQDAARLHQGGDALTALSILEEAYRLAPQHLMVQVALYRHHYFSRNYASASTFADEVMIHVARQLKLPEDWRAWCASNLIACPREHLGSLRLFLQALMGSGYLDLRLGREAQGREKLARVADLDPLDRLGARALLAALDPPDPYADPTP